MAADPEQPAGQPSTRGLKLREVLPYRNLLPVAAGVLSGLLLRFVFSGSAGKPYAPMLASFIYVAPLVVAAVTVYVAERAAPRTWGYYFLAGAMANVFFVLGTMLVLIEGLICAIVIVPLLAVLGGLGGLAMGAVCRLTKWPRRTLYALWALPVALGAVEHRLPLPERRHNVQAETLIHATPQRVWAEIQHPGAIGAGEVDRALFFRIGVPLPQSSETHANGPERVRAITMGKHVHFEQVVTEWEEERHVRWVHRYAADSFPPYALDEHVVLGGHYFDVGGAAYTLQPVGGGTLLRVELDYRVSTPFNWYADPLASFMLQNLENTLLRFYKSRAELPAG